MLNTHTITHKPQSLLFISYNQRLNVLDLLRASQKPQLPHTSINTFLLLSLWSDKIKIRCPVCLFPLKMEPVLHWM